MAIPLQCPKCLKKFKVKDDYAGSRIKCPDCRQSIPVPGPAAVPQPPPIQPPVSDRQPVEVTFGPAEEEAWSTPEWKEPERDEHVADPGMPFPDAPNPSAQPQPSSSGTGVQVSFGLIMDFAQDPAMITYVLHWMAICAAAVLIAGGIASLVPIVGIFIGGLILCITFYVTLLGIVSGVGYLTGTKLHRGKAPDVSDAWALFTRRIVSLMFGTAGVWLVTALVVVLIGGVIAGVSHLPYVGQLLGGLLLIPTFIGVIFAMSLLFNLYLMPVVIGVEDCTAMEAFRILREMVAKNRFALYSRYFNAIGTLVPAMIPVLLITVIPLAISLMLCAGRVMTAGVGYESSLLIVSTAAILLTAMSFGVVLVTVCLVLVYCQSASRAIVYASS